MATVTNNDIARAIYLASKGHAGEGQHLFFKKVTDFLARKRLLSKSSLILSSLEKIINKEENKILVKVKSAETLKEKTREGLVQNLKKRYPLKGIILQETVDKKLLGGIRLEVEDEIIDLSIRNRMKQLQEYLTN